MSSSRGRASAGRAGGGRGGGGGRAVAVDGVAVVDGGVEMKRVLSGIGLLGSDKTATF